MKPAFTIEQLCAELKRRGLPAANIDALEKDVPVMREIMDAFARLTPFGRSVILGAFSKMKEAFAAAGVQ